MAYIPRNDSCGKGSLVDQEYESVYENVEISTRGIFLEMILAASVRLLITNMEMLMNDGFRL